jgi:hypothetical protein
VVLVLIKSIACHHATGSSQAADTEDGRRTYMRGSCKHIEYTVADSRQSVVLDSESWVAIKKTSLSENIARSFGIGRNFGTQNKSVPPPAQQFAKVHKPSDTEWYTIDRTL